MSILSFVVANGKHNLIYFKTFLFRGYFFTRKWDFAWRVSDCKELVGLLEMNLFQEFIDSLFNTL